MSILTWLRDRLRRQEPKPQPIPLTANHLRHYCVPRGAADILLEVPHTLVDNETRWRSIDDVLPDLDDGKVVVIVDSREYRVEPDTPVRYT